jgi:phosphoribosylglycinamide formyltransferase-1
MKKIALVVLVSGNGSNLQAILDAIESGDLNAEVRAVISNNKNAYALERANLAGIPTEVLIKAKEQNRSEYDIQLAEIVAKFQPDWIILAGWMRILSMNFLRCFPGKVINLHPALPGKFPGVHAIERAYQSFKDGEIDKSGVMVHLVPDEGVDSGPVLNQRIVEILHQDSLEEFETRIHACEHVLLVETLQNLVNNGG